VFTTLARTVVVRKGKKGNQHELREVFPHFLWLLRDVIVDPVNKAGKPISATEYLMTRVLARDDDNFEESKEEKVGRAIVTFFPKIECRLLPPPSEDKEVMKRIESNQSKLSEQFNTGVEELVTFIKCNVEAKRVFGKGIYIDGPTLAPLVEETIKAINEPNAIPALENTWKSVITLCCKAVQEELVAEYIQVMTARYTAASKEKPLEEDFDKKSKLTSDSVHETLMGIHRTVVEVLNGVSR